MSGGEAPRSGDGPPAPLLLHPGPTGLHPEVAEAAARPMMPYRGPEMRALLGRVSGSLSEYLGSARRPVLLTASGTGAMEASLANTLSPGDRVVGLGGGQFAERFLGIARAYGLETVSLDTPWGRSADPERLRAALARHRDTKAVLLTHCETSTGVLHPVADLLRTTRESGEALVLVDAVSSLGATPLAVDDFDVVFTASQKAWGLPPGLAPVWTSARAEAAAATARLPRFYFDFARYREAAAGGVTPFTPALPVFFALEAGIRLMLREGREAVFRRHAAAAEAARDAVAAAGLELVADSAAASKTVTAARLPEGADWAVASRRLQDDHGFVLAGGLGKWAGRILRIGHLGWITPDDLRPLGPALRAVFGAPLPGPPPTA